MRPTFMAVALMLIGCPAGNPALAQQHKPSRPIGLTKLKVVGDFEGKKDGKTAVDISGISCLEPKDGKRTCLLVNDENRNAQYATLEKDQLTVGKTVTLIGKDPSSDTLGKAPKPTCKEGDDGFKDLDGEGVAYAKPNFYVVGSHGCSRSSDEFRLSSFILAQVGPDQKVATTYRVSELLVHAKKVEPYFTKNLDKQNGLNIEGIAASGDTLWFGLRAPVVDGGAYLVSGSIAYLFHPDKEQASMTGDVVHVDLDGRGIRDLAPLPNDQLLILAGPAQKQDVPYKLFVFDPKTGAKEIGVLPDISKDGTTGKAEGITVLDATSKKISFVVVFDGLENGDPHSGEVDLPD